MRCLAAILTLVCLAEARSVHSERKSSISFDPYIFGGTEAALEEFPWQLSVQKLAANWIHDCGGSLLAENAALVTAKCVDGEPLDNIRVIAGLHLLSDNTTAQTSSVASYKVHENYDAAKWTLSNDIAIITLAQPFTTSVSNVALMTLPPDNSNQFVGTVCTVSGWGRTSSGDIASDALQKLDIPVISTYECSDRLAPTGGVCDDSQIAVYDATHTQGACYGDLGGPMHCPVEEGTVVAGIASWFIVEGAMCSQAYPTVYTRTAFYLNWIILNTPSP